MVATSFLFVVYAERTLIALRGIVHHLESLVIQFLSQLFIYGSKVLRVVFALEYSQGQRIVNSLVVRHVREYYVSLIRTLLGCNGCVLFALALSGTQIFEISGSEYIDVAEHLFLLESSQQQFLEACELQRMPSLATDFILDVIGIEGSRPVIS